LAAGVEGSAVRFQHQSVFPFSANRRSFDYADASLKMTILMAAPLILTKPKRFVSFVPPW